MWYALGAVLLVLIVIIEAWDGVRASYSGWQIQQKQRLVNKQSKNAPLAERDLLRIKLKTNLLSLQVGLLILLFVGFFVAMGQALGWLRAWVPLVIAIPATNILAKIGPIKRLVNRGYLVLEPKLLKLLNKTHLFGRLTSFSSLTTTDSGVFDRVNSVSELFYIIDNSPSVVDDVQNSLVKSGFKFLETAAKQVMTSLDEVFLLEADDLLGPLRIDELHKTGSEFFPVLDKDGQVLGVVNLESVSSLKSQDSLTAEAAVESNLVIVDEDEPLESLLRRLISDRVFVAIVTRHDRPVGLIELKTVLSQLIGRQV